MKLKDLREKVLEANLELVRHGLVLYTFGNASGIDREEGLVVIKPSGMNYQTMKPEDLVIVDLDGRTVDGLLGRRLKSRKTTSKTPGWPFFDA